MQEFTNLIINCNSYYDMIWVWGSENWSLEENIIKTICHLLLSSFNLKLNLVTLFINSYVTFVLDPVWVFHIAVQPSIADNAAYLDLNLNTIVIKHCLGMMILLNTYWLKYLQGFCSFACWCMYFLSHLF